jgi:hypothetical protein
LSKEKREKNMKGIKTKQTPREKMTPREKSNVV